MTPQEVAMAMEAHKTHLNRVRDVLITHGHVNRQPAIRSILEAMEKLTDALQDTIVRGDDLQASHDVVEAAQDAEMAGNRFKDTPET